MRKKILWIEDSANDEMLFLATPVHLTGEFDLQVALNATEALARLQGPAEYEAVIVDLRIPPGSDRRWIKIYDGTQKGSRLGLVLLRAVLGKDGPDWKLQFSKPHLIKDPLRYGVLSVENVAGDVAELEVLYRDKSDDVNALLRLIREILKQRGNGNHS